MAENLLSRMTNVGQRNKNKKIEAANTMQKNKMENEDSLSATIGGGKMVQVVE